MMGESRLPNTSPPFLSLRFTPYLIFFVPALASLGQYAGWPPLRPSQVGAINFALPLLLILLMTTSKAPHKNDRKKSLLIWSALTCLVIFGLINITYRGSQLANVKDWLVIVLGLVAMIVLPSAVRANPQYIKYLALGHLFALWLQIFIIIVEKFFGFRLNTSSDGYLLWQTYSYSGKSFNFLVGSLGNPNDLALFLVFTLPVALFALRFQKFKSPYIFTVLLSAYCIFSTQSRSGIVCLFFVGIIFATIAIRAYIKISKFTLSLFMLTTLLSLFAIFYTFTDNSYTNWLRSTFENFSLVDSDYLRIDWAILALQKVAFESPILGFGPGATERWLIGSGLARAEVHNGVVQIGFEYGLISMFLFALILISQLFQHTRRFFLSPLKSNQLLISVLICSMVTIIFWTQFTSQAVRDIPFWWSMATVLALATNLDNLLVREEPDEKVINRAHWKSI